MWIPISIICFVVLFAGCAKRPETLTEQYDQKEMDAAITKARQTVDDFLTVLDARGADAFSVKAPITDENGTEHFWVTDVTFQNGVFTGKIGNDPGIVKNVKMGQSWKVGKAEISDWMYMRNGRIHGGFTIDPLLASMPKQNAEELRTKLVR